MGQGSTKRAELNRLSEMQFTMYKALKQLLLIDWAHRHTRTHPKEMVAAAFIWPSAWEGRRAEGKSLHLHLSASCGLVELVRWRDLNPPPQRSTKHQGRGIERRTPASMKADEARDDRRSRPRKLPHGSDDTRRGRPRQPDRIRQSLQPLLRWEGFLSWPLAS